MEDLFYVNSGEYVKNYYNHIKVNKNKNNKLFLLKIEKLPTFESGRINILYNFPMMLYLT